MKRSTCMMRRARWQRWCWLLPGCFVILARGRDRVSAASRTDAAVAGSSIALGQGLGSLPLLTRSRSRSISAENPTGAKGKGGMAVPDPAQVDPPESGRAADELGQGWKVRPFLRVNKGTTATLMDVDGPGVIQHIWMVEGLSRAHVLRFYWDGEETPSIEVPVPDFFAVGHGKFAPVNSLAVVVNPRNALNCYWPMPFRKHAKVTLTNESPTKDLTLLAYQIDYAETEVPAQAGYFHAQFRRARTDRTNPYVILDGVRGRGRYVGTFLAWTQREKGWFGEGEIKFYIDGDTEFPTICGTGTEDYFGGSYGFPASVQRALQRHHAAGQRRRGAPELLEPVPLAHHGPDQLRSGPAVAVVDPFSEVARFVGVEVRKSYDEVKEAFDAVIVTDVVRASASYAAAAAICGAARVLAPDLLGLRKYGGIGGAAS